MSAEVTEILEHVHRMSNRKRILMGISLFAGIILIYYISGIRSYFSMTFCHYSGKLCMHS